MTLPDSLRKGELASVEKVDAPDAATLVLTLKQPDATLLAQLSDRAGMMLSPKSFADADVAAVGRKPICSGPYKFVERIQNDRVVLEKFDQYYDAKDYAFKRITFLPDVYKRQGLLDSVQAFTIGFWYQSDGTANDRSVLGNKDYNSGGNPGITIAQWAGPELRFNLAGGTRVDINGVKFTPNKPVYVAMVIDKTAKTMACLLYTSAPVTPPVHDRVTVSCARLGMDLSATPWR